MIKQLDHLDEHLNAMVDQNISTSSDELNQIMLVFTVATVLMIPPTVIAGLFGMNVRVPLTDWDL